MRQQQAMYSLVSLFSVFYYKPRSEINSYWITIFCVERGGNSCWTVRLEGRLVAWRFRRMLTDFHTSYFTPKVNISNNNKKFILQSLNESMTTRDFHKSNKNHPYIVFIITFKSKCKKALD